MEEKNYSTLFYADDDTDDLDFFKEVAAEINETVVLFEEGEQLLYRLKNPPPKASVIFLDLNMPAKSGFDVLKEIKATPETSNIPVVILTTSTNASDIELCKKLGANLYIRKPSSLKGLKKALSHVLSIEWNNVHSDSEFLYQY